MLKIYKKWDKIYI